MGKLSSGKPVTPLYLKSSMLKCFYNFGSLRLIGWHHQSKEEQQKSLVSFYQHLQALLELEILPLACFLTVERL